ncbi:MAG TPA: ROK family protein [Blastocatellia bacterium]|nr:ROK family protein [Blastocatellia bacterium]HMV84720.1 ROK family protein [Blastocatellia bacterium]HMX24810.1 ROK family protein [Blastocatellia bacterium]HMY75853.1 ROK family protein [Blastocatellia bacterium]HMZ19146.1 ROK family protein [Blastocatellia bacterium]
MKKTSSINAIVAGNGLPGKKTLAFDIGGTGLKASLLDEQGEIVTDRIRVDTPKPCPPAVLIEKLKEMIAQLPEFDRVSVGFPGVVRKGVTISCKNLGSDEWCHFDLQSAVADATGKPTAVINDADMQGLGAIKGHGVELVLTLGTGLGSAFFEDGRIAPHIELAHIPFRKGQTYEEQLGNRALKKAGKKRWNQRLEKAIEHMRTLTNFDKLYLGGGNAANVTIDLGNDIEIVSNALGMSGGIWLWKKRD